MMMSYAGLTRVPIDLRKGHFQRRWVAGSSPAMTAAGSKPHRPTPGRAQAQSRVAINHSSRNVGGPTAGQNPACAQQRPCPGTVLAGAGGLAHPFEQAFFARRIGNLDAFLL